MKNWTKTPKGLIIKRGANMDFFSWAFIVRAVAHEELLSFIRIVANGNELSENLETMAKGIIARAEGR